MRYFTNLEVTPDQVHEIGSGEVARIRSEMETVIRQTGFKGDFAAFLKYLRTDPRFYAHTPDELLKDASYIAKQIDGILPGYFGKLPRPPCAACSQCPRSLRRTTPVVAIHRRPLAVTRVGEFWVNTYATRKAAPLRPDRARAARGGTRPSSAGLAGARAGERAAVSTRSVSTRVR